MKLASKDGTQVVNVAPSLVATIIRGLRDPRPKRNLPAELDTQALLALDGNILQELRATAPGKPNQVVFPIAAIWIAPAN